MSFKSVFNTWTTDGHFRPPVSYYGQLVGLGGFRGLVYGVDHLRLRSSLYQLLRIAIPTVHASASGSATGDVPVVESPNTTVDLLAASQPNIVINENDILAVLEKETGWDRVRVMFSKE